jgi:hypothetical protein
MSGKRQLMLGLVIGFVILALPSLFLLPQSLIRTVEYRLGTRFPVWSWQHGTTLMQRAAADVLVTRIEPGMSYREVLGIIGPGSQNWSVDKDRQLGPEDGVSFNIRDDGNDGIDVDFRDGKVVAAGRYD